ncbi:hypothetical protein A2U01_0081815, partial [Trifolium medium]|nr:hypothetical protein [Trifolium medium]
IITRYISTKIYSAIEEASETLSPCQRSGSYGGYYAPQPWRHKSFSRIGYEGPSEEAESYGTTSSDDTSTMPITVSGSRKR